MKMSIMDPQQTIHGNASTLEQYQNQRQYLYLPAPVSPYLQAILLLLETPYLPSHIRSTIQPELCPDDHQPNTLDSRIYRPSVENSTAGNNFVYIIPHAYLSKWLTWVRQQEVPDQENDRFIMAVSIAATLHELYIPTVTVQPPETTSNTTIENYPPRNISSVERSMKQLKTKAAKKKSKKGKSQSLHSPPPPPHDPSQNQERSSLVLTQEQSPPISVSIHPNPGPVDSTCLSTPSQPFLLHPKVTLHTNITSPNNEDNDIYHGVAVPELFYQYICKNHGVICQDGTFINFQPPSIPSKKDDESTTVVYHFQYRPDSRTRQELLEETRLEENELVYGMNRLDVSTDKEPIFNPSHPIEFRRKVLTTIVKEGPSLNEDVDTEVELFPYEFCYRKVCSSISKDDIEEYYTWKDDESHVAHGCILISRSNRIHNAWKYILNCLVARDRQPNCVRLWYDRRQSTYRQPEQRGTTWIGDGFELVDLTDVEYHALSVEDWVKRQIGSPWNQCTRVNLLVEIRTSPESPWPRKLLELSHRVRVGDFVDAQDSNGTWYEAVVREVSKNDIKVHFCGWSSKWDHVIRRMIDDEDIPSRNKRMNPPVPLWTKTTRWRDLLCVGDLVEVRCTSSTVKRPKWVRGVVKWIGSDHDSVQSTVGGADLEILEVDSHGLRTPLLLLHRKRQVLVHVKQESTLSSQEEDALCIDSTTIPQAYPPHLRWVNLYGEEICKWNTHLRETPNGDFIDDRGQIAVEKPAFMISPIGKSFSSEPLLGNPVAEGSVGLFNLGNTCYMNAILQCLNQIDIVTSYFLKEKHLQDLNRSNPLGTGGELAQAYASLLHSIWTGKYSALSPDALKSTFAKFAPQFNNTYQHDSHEFFSFLLDGLHEDVNRILNKPYIEDIEGFGMDCDAAAMSSWQNYLKRHDSFFVDHFHDNSQHHNTLFNSLDKFTQGEELDEANGWYCSKCQKHVCAIKKIQLWTTPDILTLHLKRFTFKPNVAKKNGLLRSKIQDVINFPIDRLDLHKYVFGPKDESAPPVYKLIGVAEHSGMTTTSGHYTATVRNMKSDVWYHFNDNRVRVTNAEASISKGAYILFYERSNGTSRWAGMEKLMDSVNKPLIDSDGFVMVSKKKKKK